MRRLLRNSSVFAGGVVTVHGVAGTGRAGARRLRDNSPLHVSGNGEARSSVWGLPSALQNGFYYIPSHIDDLACEEDEHIVLSATSDMEVYVLWPSLQDPPAWLRTRFQQLRGTHLKVSWCFSLKQRAVLNLSNHRRAFEQQTLQVWRLRATVHADTTMSLPGLGLKGNSSTPVYPYVFCVKPEAAPLPAAAALAVGASPSWALKPCHLLRCSIQQLRTMVEDGVLCCGDLSSSTASALIRRCLKEEDAELLLVLLELGLGATADAGAMQEVISYAVANHELQLLQETLASGFAELRKQELVWWIRELVGGPNLFDGERLLADYCLARRNPLSTMSAVEAVLLSLQADHGRSSQNGVGHLARKFGAVKRLLLQQLQERHAQQLAAAAVMDTAPAAAGDIESGGAQLLQPTGLQQVINNCMEVKFGGEDCSIHDVSPFRKAVRIKDVQMLNQPPIKAFAEQLWRGLELQQLYDGHHAARAPPRRCITRKNVTSMDPAGTPGRQGTPSRTQQDEQGTCTWESGAPTARMSSGAAGKAEWSSADKQSALQKAAPQLQDSRVGYELLQNMGLAKECNWSGPAALACRLLHVVVVTPRAFFNSPRGQWLMHCALEMVFLATFQCLVLRASIPALRAVFTLLVTGNLVQALHHIIKLHAGSMRRYLSSNMAKLNMLVYLGLAAVAAGWLVEGPDKAIWAWDLAAGLAVPVWARALGVVVPANARLGALLQTLGRMVEEASSMGIIILVLLLGFSTTLYAIYHNVLSSYSTFMGAFRMFVGVMASDLNMQDFEAASNGDPYYTWFGQCMIMLFIVVVNILLMTLLIAVINHTYHPEGIAQQTTVMFATSADAYMLQVQEGIALPPINILQLLLLWIPKRYRHRVPHQACLKWWLPPVDGYSSASGSSRSAALIPTGPSELAYVLFVLTLYPVMGLAAVGLLLLYLPVGVVYFAAQGHKQWLGSSHSRQRSSRRGRGRRGPRVSCATKEDLDMYASVKLPMGEPGGHLLPLATASCPDEITGAQQQASGGSCWAPCGLAAALLGRWVALLAAGVQRVLLCVAAAGVGLVAQLALLLVVLVVLWTSLVCQLLWALWCTFCWWLLPQGMVQQQQIISKRAADYWSAAEVLAAYDACQVLNTRGALRMAGSAPGGYTSRMSADSSWRISTDGAHAWPMQVSNNPLAKGRHNGIVSNGALWTTFPSSSQSTSGHQSEAGAGVALGPDSELPLPGVSLQQPAGANRVMGSINECTTGSCAMVIPMTSFAGHPLPTPIPTAAVSSCLSSAPTPEP